MGERTSLAAGRGRDAYGSDRARIGGVGFDGDEAEGEPSPPPEKNLYPPHSQLQRSVTFHTSSAARATRDDDDGAAAATSIGACANAFGRPTLVCAMTLLACATMMTSLAQRHSPKPTLGGVYRKLEARLPYLLSCLSIRLKCAGRGALFPTTLRWLWVALLRHALEPRYFGDGT